MAGHILIANDATTDRIVMKVKLGAARYQTSLAGSGAEVLARAAETRPDLVILDAALPDGAVPTCAQLKTDPRTRSIPVLFVDAAPTRAARLAALGAGADDYLEKPVDDHALLARLRNLMRTRATYDELTRRQETSEALGFAEASAAFARSARVAVVAPRTDLGLVWRRALGFSLAAQILTLEPGAALTHDETGSPPDAYVIAGDLDQPDEGLQLLSELRARAGSRNAVILIVDNGSRPGFAPLALDMGANAVVPAPFDAEEIGARLKSLVARKLETDALRESFDRRLSLAAIDPLTGLFNRRYAETYLARAIDAARAHQKPLALMLLDLDRFKLVNDTWGHLAGDEVLREAARRLGANLREVDLVARWGGEEFIVAMPETGLAAAEAAAERLRQVLAERPIFVPQVEQPLTVTVSIGVAVCAGRTGPTPSADSLIARADAALYASKHEGRNVVTMADDRAA